MAGRPRRATRPHLDSILAKLWRAHVERMLARERGTSVVAAETKIRQLSEDARRQGLTPVELRIKLREMDEQTASSRFQSPISKNVKRTSRPDTKETFRRESGQYGFSDMSAPCTCGHTLGEHGISRSRRCLASDDCACERFVKSKKRTSRNGKQRTSRNPIPPPPQDPVRRTMLAWAQRTFAPGTPVVLSEHEWVAGLPDLTEIERVYVPDGTRAEVLDVGMYKNENGVDEVWIALRVHDARRYAAGNLPTLELDLLNEMWRELDRRKTNIISKALHAHDYNWGRIRPLVDNWPAAAPVRRLALPASQRRPSYKMRANKIPHPLHRGRDGFPAWIERTYREGTPVRLKLPVSGWYADIGERTTVDRGTIAEVIEMGQGATVTIGGWLAAPIDGRSRPFRASLFPQKAWVSLEPLTDNWGAHAPERLSFGGVRAPTLPAMRENKRRTSRKKGRMWA